MKKQTKQKYLDQLLTLLLFTVFLTSVLLVLLTGADVVNKLSARDQKNYNQRTTIQYLATRIRQADQSGMISVSTMGDSDAFVIKEVIDDTPYETWIYCYDGYLCELFSESGMELEAEYGEYILPLSSLQINETDSCFQLDLQLEDEWEDRLIITLRSKEGVSQ